LEHHKFVERFRDTYQLCLLRMWKSQINADGEPLSRFERDPLWCTLRFARP